jgi:hypothetical protein
VKKGTGLPATNRVIGVDFDNTIASYDDLIYKTAVQRGLIEESCRKNKMEIRDRIRQQPNGEEEWQKVQAFIYGLGMAEACLIEGVREFFLQCHESGAKVYIVSHKTKYANYDETGTNLRCAALSWMKKKDFFSAEGLGISPDDVFFESTRLKKIQRISRLNCSCFIDDLVEVFQEDAFPQDIGQILYAPNFGEKSRNSMRVVATWEQIGSYVFGRN